MLEGIAPPRPIRAQWRTTSPVTVQLDSISPLHRFRWRTTSPVTVQLWMQLPRATASRRLRQLVMQLSQSGLIATACSKLYRFRSHFGSSSAAPLHPHDPSPFRLTLQVARFPSPATQIHSWRDCHTRDCHTPDLPAHASPEWGTTTRTPAAALSAPTTPATTQDSRAPPSTRTASTQSARNVGDLILTGA